MSEIIRIDSDLLLYALKYAIDNDTADKEKVIKSIVNNMDELDNNELEEYIHIIGESEKVDSENDEYTWFDLKEEIEKEIYVRKSVKKVMDIIKRRNFM